MLSDKDAIEYFLLSVLAEIKIEYQQSNHQMSEDEYMIVRLSDISRKIVRESKYVQ